MQDILNHIASTRRDNNVLWMEILAIALRSAPQETAKVLKAIQKNDRNVTELVGNIVDEIENGYN